MCGRLNAKRHINESTESFFTRPLTPQELGLQLLERQSNYFDVDLYLRKQSHCSENRQLWKSFMRNIQLNKCNQLKGKHRGQPAQSQDGRAPHPHDCYYYYQEQLGSLSRPNKSKLLPYNCLGQVELNHSVCFDQESGSAGQPLYKQAAHALNVSADEHFLEDIRDSQRELLPRKDSLKTTAPGSKQAPLLYNSLLKSYEQQSSSGVPRAFRLPATRTAVCQRPLRNQSTAGPNPERYPPSLPLETQEEQRFDEFDIIRAYYDKKYGQKLRQLNEEKKTPVPEVAGTTHHHLKAAESKAICHNAYQNRHPKRLAIVSTNETVHRSSDAQRARAEQPVSVHGQRRKGLKLGANSSQTSINEELKDKAPSQQPPPDRSRNNEMQPWQSESQIFSPQ